MAINNTPKDLSGSVNHTGYASRDFESLYLSNSQSDLTLIVCGQRFSAHKLFLISRSPYFRTLLNGTLPDDEVKLENVEEKPFREVLRYIYTGRMTLSDKSIEEIFDIMETSKIFLLRKVEKYISEYLFNCSTLDNVCRTYEAAKSRQIEPVIRNCLRFITRYGDFLMRDKGYLDLTLESWHELLSIDTIFTPRIRIFDAIIKWHETHPKADVQSLLGRIDFRLIPLKALELVVKPKCIVPEHILDRAIHVQRQIVENDFADIEDVLLNVNVAHIRQGAKVIHGSNQNCILQCDTSRSLNRDLEPTTYQITERRGDGIIIEFRQPYIINHCKLTFIYRRPEKFRYSLEASLDGDRWFEIVDRIKLNESNKQFIYFDPKRVKYVKVIGIESVPTNIMKLLQIECRFLGVGGEVLNWLQSKLMHVCDNNMVEKFVKAQRNPGLVYTPNSGSTSSENSVSHEDFDDRCSSRLHCPSLPCCIII